MQQLSGWNLLIEKPLYGSGNSTVALPIMQLSNLLSAWRHGSNNHPSHALDKERFSSPSPRSDRGFQANVAVKRVEQTTCCIVGGGPAGAVLALLLARKGVSVMLLEAHMDFDREFRGDTIHPSVMEIMEEIGLADRLLQIRHARLSTVRMRATDGEEGITIGVFQRLRTRYPYIMIVAQSKFLEFITNEAKQYPNFRLVMGAQVNELVEENGKVCGVRYRGPDGRYEVRAHLTVGADGRFSRLRKLAGFESIKTSPPMDILWFRLSRKEGDPDEGLTGRFGARARVVLINRFDYWQIGYIIPKGGYQQVRAQGLEHLREVFAETVPELADRAEEIQEWKQISVLSVESDRLPRWYRPGLLLIGDAAHIMSPVGGVGINYAIQDAVVAANVLTEKLKAGNVQGSDLARVQRQRELPTRLIQTVQTFLQKNVLKRLLASRETTIPSMAPFLVRFLSRVPVIRDIPARFVAFGLWPAHVKNP